MGWSISSIDNTVKISAKCAKDLLRECGAASYWNTVEDFSYKGYLWFNIDDSEHMDYVGDPVVLEVLEKHKVNGIITFGSLEGDNAGSFWGYQFDNGKLTRLVGKVVFSALEQETNGTD